MRIFVTGASGFVGSAFVRYVAEHRPDLKITAMVRDSFQKNQKRLSGPILKKAVDENRLTCFQGDLLEDISGVTEDHDAVVNFAARTFVDHSIKDPAPFIQANVIGTSRILEDARRNKVKYFVQISTDEVYGAILDGAYSEESPVNPTNPYSASKLGADALVISYAHTFGMWTAVTRTENNYGPYQHPQKVFPTFVKKALAGEKLPVYGDGLHRRQWLWVDDHVRAVLTLLDKASGWNQKIKSDIKSGLIWHVAGSQELTNLELATRILVVLDDIVSDFHGKNRPLDQRIEHIEDHNIRPGHDRRYALTCDRMRRIGWKPEVGLDEGIRKAVQWYAQNEWWLS